MSISNDSDLAREDLAVEALANAIHDMSGDDITRLARVMIQQRKHTGQPKTTRPLALAIEVLDAMKPATVDPMAKDLHRLVARLDAGSQCCANTFAGNTKAYEMASAACEVRHILACHGNRAPDTVQYDSAADALKSVSALQGLAS